MSDLVPAHGGYAEPISRTVPEAERPALVAAAASLVRVPVSDADLSTIYRFGDGALTPLAGPMDRATYERVLDEMVIVRGGTKYAWGIPLSLPVTSDLAATIAPGQTVALVNSGGETVATLAISDVFEWDKRRYLSKVYGTDRTDHPGADMVLKNDASASHLLGGSIRVLPRLKDARFGRYLLSPLEVRALFRARGWDRVVAFQTRNPLHRAHEFALVHGLEQLIRQGHDAGACLHPLIGDTKDDDVGAEIRMRTYEALMKSRTIGEGDSDPTLWVPRGERVADRVMLLALDIKMFYAGPREALMHAIYRQNFGFTDIIIGRKQADAPFHDGTAIWDDFDAQAIFDVLHGELRIQPLKVGVAAYFESVGRVDLVSNHPGEPAVLISGQAVRWALLEDHAVDPRIMRPGTAHILAEAMGPREISR